MKHYRIDYPYFDKNTGSIVSGNYITENIIKIAELKRVNNRQIIPLYIATYRVGQTITLNKKKDTVDFKVVFYGNLSNEENYFLIKRFFKANPNKSELLEFIPTHYKELIEAFKGEDNLNPYLLQLAFDFNRLPNEFEMVYKGNIVNDIASLKETWNKDKQSFEILTYIK